MITVIVNDIISQTVDHIKLVTQVPDLSIAFYFFIRIGTYDYESEKDRSWLFSYYCTVFSIASSCYFITIIQYL